MSHTFKFAVRNIFILICFFAVAIVVSAQTDSDQAVTSVAPSEVSDTKTLPPPPPSDRFVPPPEFNRQQVPPPPGGQFDDRRSQPIENWDNPPKGQFDANGRPGLQPKPSVQKFDDRQVQPVGRPSGDNFQQNGQMNNGEGDWEAQQQKMDAEQAKREAEQQKREEQMVKKQATQMAKNLQQNITSINKRIAKLKTVGVSLTQECVDTVAVFSDAVVKVKSATSREDLEDVQDVMSSMEELGQCRQTIEQLISAPSMLKKATATIKNLKKKKVDVAEAEALLTAIQTKWTNLKSAVPQNSDVEAFFEDMESLGDTVMPLMDKPENQRQGAAVFESGFLDTIVGWFGL